ncbi:MAG: DNA-processing protein DprA [Thermoanaerobaculia bacterium]
MGGEFAEDLIVALNASPLISRDAACRLSVTPEAWVGAGSGETGSLAQELGVSPRSLRFARECARTAHHLAARERARARNLGAEILTRRDPSYPAGLLDLELPPPALYVLGELPSAPGVAIVGSRNTDPYGVEAAERFAGELSTRGAVIVSGFAIGIDSVAHKAALSAGGKTLAVLGCGLDVDYPRSNRRLRAQIAEAAALVTEFPVGTRPEARHFPIRNRIIAALACGTLVVRGTPHSGSLITAGCALVLGRQVWAIPGNIFDPRSMGPNSLIRDGAHPVQSPDELFETLPTPVQVELETGAGKPEPNPEPSDIQPGRTDLARLFQAVPAGSTVDAVALVEASGLALDRVLSLLVELEIMGFLNRYPGPAWGRAGASPSGSGRRGWE